MNNILNNFFGGKDPEEDFPSIYKQKKQNTYVENPNEDETVKNAFGRNALEGFPSIYKKKDKK